MAYKDKEKQKQASKERQRRYRALRQDGKLNKVLRQGVTKGVTSEGVTSEGVTGKALLVQSVTDVIPEGVTFEDITGVKARPGMQATEVEGLVRQASKRRGVTMAEAGWKQGKGFVTTEVGE